MLLQPCWNGQISYAQSLKHQEDMKELCIKNKKDYAIGFECPTTITLGLRGGEQDLLYTQEEYQKKDINIIGIQRGGQATLHSLGQLVVYPVVDIRKNKMKVRDFIQFIERVTQSALEKLGVPSHKEENQAGLFTKNGKIAFFGIHVSRGVSQHGLAINVRNDLNLFSLIRSCGVADRKHDCLSRYIPDITLKEVFDLWIQKAQGL